MRSLIVLALLVSSAAADPKLDVPARMHAYYGTRAGYSKVYRNVMEWHKTTQNGCVAFASTALRQVGVEIPQTDVYKHGYNVSRITGAFASYLAEDLGWERIEDPAELRAGDIVFTTETSPGYPSHVMMFDGWVKKGVTGSFVDNQGFHVSRAIAPKAGSDVDGFGFALRPRAVRT